MLYFFNFKKKHVYFHSSSDFTPIMSIKFYVMRKGLDTQMNEIKDNYALTTTATATATAEPRNRGWKIIEY